MFRHTDVKLKCIDLFRVLKFLHSNNCWHKLDLQPSYKIKLISLFKILFLIID
jgi:hypothetical protein